MTNKKIITIAIVVATVHFILTSVIGHYISVQIGTQMGKIVSGGLVEVYESPDSSEEEVNRIVQGMMNKGDDITGKWKVPLILISLPAKPLMNPYLTNYRHARLKKVLSKEITKNQFYSQGIIIDYTATFVNSLVFGLLVYIALKLINKYKLKHNKTIERDTQ